MMLNHVKSFLVALSIMMPLATVATRADTFFADPCLLFGAALFFLFCVGFVRLEEVPPHHQHPAQGQKLEETRHANTARDDDVEGTDKAVSIGCGNTPDQGLRKRKRNIDDDGEAERELEAAEP
jgi:hypothetical protein